MIEDWKDLLVLFAFQCLPRYITEPGNGRSSFNVQTYKFSSSFFFILLLVPLQTYVWQKKLGIANWPIEGKNNMFMPDNGQTKKQIPTHEHPLGASHGNLNMAIAPYRYTLKRTAKLWGSLGFCSVSSDNFFVVTCTCLSLVLTIDFCYSHKNK